MSKRIYNKWKNEEMDEALSKLNQGVIGFNEAHRQYKIPKPTLRRHLQGLNKNVTFGRPKDLTIEMEKELVAHILNLESSFFGLTIVDIRKLAYQLAEKYKLKHRFNKEKGMAGKKWYYNFMKNNPSLSLRTPEATSMARAKAFNKQRVYEFFDKYESILDEYKFTRNQIYNVDATGLSTVHKPPKIIAQKGKKQVGAITSVVTNTGICCMNAAGEFVPPMLIFKRVRMNDSLKRGAPPGIVFGCSQNGSITSELFVEWLTHLIKYIKLEKSSNKQILLLLDGRTTHTKNIEAINLACEYGIVMLSFPSHTTHRLQPLDRSFFKPLKTNFSAAASTWLRANPGNTIKPVNVSELFGIANCKSVRIDIALNGFKSSGIWPCNRHEFQDKDFSAPLPAKEYILCTNPTQERTTHENIETPQENKDAPAANITATSSTSSSSQIMEQLNKLSQIPIALKIKI